MIIKRHTLFTLIFLIFCNFIVCGSLFATAPSKVKVEKSEDIWKLTVDGRPYIIKGLEYSADIVGTYPQSNDWMWDDRNNNGKIDGPYDSWVDLNRDDFHGAEEYTVGDFALLKAMGCNTIRVYHSENINKELLRDLYKRYGIRVIMGNLLGAYTKGSDADWNEGTDYRKLEHKQNMIKSVREMVEEHKDEPYVLMWMLGNENDVKGDQVNSTKTNTNAYKYPEEFAKFVNDVCLMIKEIDQNHPIAICNATTAFLKYYKEFTPEIDVLGFNQYSGPYGFGVLWNTVKVSYDKPVLITEYGCDSYHTQKEIEDELFQANYHRAAWRDIEKNSYQGNGKGNAIGGIAYCWLDKWWLIGSPRIHDTSLGARVGATNDGLFNDEWLGICSQGDGNQSPFKRQLREVYYTYQEELWAK